MLMDGRVIAVSGAASGIGKELCRLFAQRGAKLGLIDHNQFELDTFANELRSSGVTCSAVVADVRRGEQIRDAVNAIVGSLGPIDIIIPCAGICRAATVDDLKGHEFEDVVLTNLMGTVHMIEAVLPSMLERRNGHIVGVSSLAGVRGIPFEAGYSASKAAIAAYLESIRSELRYRGVFVTTVFPGYVLTPLLEKVNSLAGADMSNGKACTAAMAAAQIAKAIDQRRARVYFPWTLAIGVRLSQLLPPVIYDRVMRRAFGRLPISRVQNPVTEPAKT